MSEPSDIKWSSCCRTRNCPEVAYDGEFLYIKDDDEKIIRIKRKQVDDLVCGMQNIVNTDSE